MVVAKGDGPILTAQDLAFRYNKSSVVAGVDLDLGPGDLLGIIGPNGSGKSTLLGLLCGLLPPSRGQVALEGRDLSLYRRDEIARVMGVVSQAPEIAPGFTVLETVLTGRFALMGRRLFESAEDLAAAQKAMLLTDLSTLADRQSGELSGGERQRLSIARALAAQPQVLLLDEPTSALDLDHQLKVMNMLESTCVEAGLSACLVSHDLNLAALFCHRLLLLYRGRPLALGSPEEVLRPEILKQAYGIDVVVDREPTRRRPRITLVPPPKPVFTEETTVLGQKQAKVFQMKRRK